MAKQLLHYKTILISGMVLLIASACTSKQANTANMAQTESDMLLQIDAVLHQRQQAVLDADSAYDQSGTAPKATAAIDAKNKAVVQAEIALKKTIDSLQNRPYKNSIAAEETIARLNGYFRSFLESRRTSSDLRMVLSANSDDSTTMQHTLTTLRAQLQEKDKKIAELERSANTGSTALQNAPVTAPINDTGTAGNTSAKGETVADLKQRNKDLSLAYSNLQNKYFSVGRDYLVLKQEHERTLNELATLRKSSNQQ